MFAFLNEALTSELQDDQLINLLYIIIFKLEKFLIVDPIRVSNLKVFLFNSFI